jgi:hypothetical protein
MIRAVHRAGIPTGQAICEYQELKSFWQVTPYLERLLQRAGRALPVSEAGTSHEPRTEELSPSASAVE